MSTSTATEVMLQVATGSERCVFPLCSTLLNISLKPGLTELVFEGYYASTIWQHHLYKFLGLTHHLGIMHKFVGLVH